MQSGCSIALLRIHVEQAIGRMREMYSILLATLAGEASECLTTAHSFLYAELAYVRKGWKHSRDELEGDDQPPNKKGRYDNWRPSCS